VLTRREVSWGEFAQDDRDRDGVVSYGEHQDSIRRAFYRFDTNRDGVLARYELGRPGARGAGWRR
jgi:Ca2+-binding EF-hand superfamily protein